MIISLSWLLDIFYPYIGGYYEVNIGGKKFFDNKIEDITISEFYLYIQVDSKFQKNYFLEKIEIIYHNEKLGEILVNKNLVDLDCYEKRYCRYKISEKELKNILNKKKMYKKIRTRFYEYGINYFEFKIFIKNKKLKDQQEEFVVDKIGIRFKRWYSIEIPYY